jgi:predicted kinase
VVGFDCLEFNPALRWIDVLSDVAFLAMDLQAHGQREWAARVLNRWLGACGDYASLLTWRWYLTYRALVRAKVLALRLEQLADPGSKERKALHSQLETYLHQAIRSSASSGPGALLLTHGVSGSGKSHLASQLCQRHGWIQLRSDVERRRLFGGWGIALAPPRQGEVYSPEVSAELYGELLPSATEAALKAGFTVVVDATFLKRHQRQLFIDLADRLGSPWLILDFPISLEGAMRRLEQRQSEGQDPSQADATVLMQQWQQREPLVDSEVALQVDGRDVHKVEAVLEAQHPEILKTTR